MADALKQVIYHEKQEPGSMLCAQHALNSLLQQPIVSSWKPMVHATHNNELSPAVHCA
jgi:ataxin-3